MDDWSWKDELYAIDTFAVLAITSILLLVLQVWCLCFSSVSFSFEYAPLDMLRSIFLLSYTCEKNRNSNCSIHLAFIIQSCSTYVHFPEILPFPSLTFRFT